MKTSELWFISNYKWIQYWSKKWSPQYWSDLITFYWLYIDKNWSKFSQIPDGDERKKFTQTWFKNNTRWESSEFNKSLSINNLDEEWSIKDEAIDNGIEIAAECELNDIKEWLIDIHNRFSDLQADRLILLRKIYLELKTHEKVLYDFYFIKMLSMRDIAKKLDLPLSTIYNMISDLKIKIKLQCGLK